MARTATQRLQHKIRERFSARSKPTGRGCASPVFTSMSIVLRNANSHYCR